MSSKPSRVGDKNRYFYLGDGCLLHQVCVRLNDAGVRHLNQLGSISSLKSAATSIASISGESKSGSVAVSGKVRMACSREGSGRPLLD